MNGSPEQPSGQQQANWQPPQSPPPAGPPNRATYAFHPRSKSPVVASFLSLMPGLGQAYVGYYRVAFLHIIVVASLVTLLANSDSGVAPFLAIFLGFFWLYNIIDAGRRAALYNYALEGGAELEISDKISVPGIRGSIAAGVVLVIAGIALLGHTAFGLSLDWVQYWWPLLRSPSAFT